MRIENLPSNPSFNQTSVSVGNGFRQVWECNSKDRSVGFAELSTMGTTLSVLRSHLAELHWADLVLGHIFLGFIIGVVAAHFYERWAQNRRWKKLRKTADIEGTYYAYLFRSDYGDTVDYSRKSGTDEISYVDENIFNIVHTETNGNIWEGTIYMATPRDGRIIWKYRKLDGQEPATKHRLGFKRCLAARGIGQHGEQRRHFYLMGEGIYGMELLEREVPTTEARNVSGA